MLIYLTMIDSAEEQSKFEKIYLEYRSLMFYVANKILNNEYDAEDAVHHAFVKIAENIKKIEEPICPKTKNFVVTIVEHKAIDIYRANQRRKNVEYIDEVEEEQATATEKLGLSDCILKLSLRYREVIFLKYYHGYSSKEIAKLLEITEANVIKIDQRAKAKLLQICRAEGIL